MVGTNGVGSILSIVLPFRPTIEKVYDITLGNETLADISLGYYGLVIANSLVYLLIGIIVFNQCANIAKKKGVLGQY